VRLADEWADIHARLPVDWAEARLRLSADPARIDQAAALLAPAGPTRSDGDLYLVAVRGGQGIGAEGLRRLLRELDEAKIEGRLELLGSTSAPLRVDVPPPSLAAAWDDHVDELPDDWSEVYAQIVLVSTGQLARAALLLAPTNPATFGVEHGYRFRVARRAGYGVSPQMARRCLARLDEEGIRGRLEIVLALSDTQHVATQGPVWYLGGRAV
jgi:hypothetical protein